MDAVAVNSVQLAKQCKLGASLRNAAPSRLQFSKQVFALKGASRSLKAVKAVAVSSEISADERTSVNEEVNASPYRVSEVDAAEQKDFNAATVSSVTQLSEDIRQITLDIELSREFIPLEKAYTKPGQRLSVKLPSGVTAQAYVSSPPFPSQANWAVLYKLKGDIPAGSTKAPQYALSVRGPVELFVPKGSPLYSLEAGASVEAGPFSASGIDLRPILFISRFPTVLLFASGPGIAALRSLVEATDVGSMSLDLREDVRLYYSAPTPADLVFQGDLEKWSSKRIAVTPIVQSSDGSWEGAVGSFASAFEDDDFEYDPATTAAVVCADKKGVQEAQQVLEEAGLPKESILVWEA